MIVDVEHPPDEITLIGVDVGFGPCVECGGDIPAGILRAIATGLGQSVDVFDAGRIPVHDLPAQAFGNRQPVGGPASAAGCGTV